MHAAVLRSSISGDGNAPRLGSAGDVLDDDALKEYHEHLKDLQEEIREAEDNHDIGKVQRLKEDMEAVTAEIGRATGLGGRNRKAADDRERARQAVSAAIRRALNAIKKEHEPLWRHLSNSLKIGEFLSYQPDQPTSWTT
jgi:non-specific serine/threonine protein kinase